MKNTNAVLLFLLMLTSCASLKHQHTSKINPNYKALSKWDNDTLEYIKYNFYKNQKFYVDKPLKDLFNDLETNILYYTPSSMINPMDKSDGVSFAVTYTKNNMDSQNHSSIPIPTVVKLIVEFKEFYYYDDALKLRKIDPEWGKAQEDFYKDFTIKEIYLYIPETE